MRRLYYVILFSSIVQLMYSQPKNGDVFDVLGGVLFPPGETIGSFKINNTDIATGDPFLSKIFYNSETIKLGRQGQPGTPSEFNSDYYFVKWSCPYGNTIKSAAPKTNDPSKIIILLSNGDIYISKLAYGLHFYDVHWTVPKKVGTGIGSLTGSESKIIGDALYIADGSRIFVSRDTAETWDIDTVGLSGYVSDIDIDTNNYVWAATYSGLFYQHPDSTVWHRDTTFPGSNCYTVFIDRRNRLFVGSYSIYKSTDNGVSWENMGGGSFSPPSSMGDDAFGNIYASAYDGGFRSDSGTAGWVNVTDTIAKKIMPSTQSYLSTAGFLHHISGDTLIHASTSFGLFTSSDQGNSWYEDSQSQLPAYRFNGFVRSGSNFLISTNRGVYRLADGDTVFTQVFPTSGYVKGITVSGDSSDAVYAIVPVATGEFSTTGESFKSTDNGTTWFRDSLGLEQFNINFWNKPYFVDAGGTQYVSNSGIFLKKEMNKSWEIDTLGLNITGSQTITSLSKYNKKGTVFALKKVAFKNYELYDHAQSDSLWEQIDISDLIGSTVDLTSDQNGNILLYNNAGVLRRYDGSTWDSIPLPPSLDGTSYATAVTVNRSGMIWSSFRNTSDGMSKGVYYSSNSGASWDYAGLDSVGISMILFKGDTTFVVTDVNGIFLFTPAGPSTYVHRGSNAPPEAYSLFQNYPNPFNPQTTISFSIPKEEVVTIKIFDALGREVQTLIHKHMKAGRHDVPFNAAQLSSGVYFYRMESGDFAASKKLLLIK